MDFELALIDAIRAYVMGQLDLEGLEDVSAEHVMRLPGLSESSLGYRMLMAVEHGISLLDDEVITEADLKQRLSPFLQPKSLGVALMSDVVSAGEAERAAAEWTWLGPRHLRAGGIHFTLSPNAAIAGWSPIWPGSRPPTWEAPGTRVLHPV